EWHYLRRRCDVHLLSLHRPGCRFVRFSHDGKRLALVTRDNIGYARCFVEIRDADSGKLERTFDMDDHYVGCVWQRGESLLVATVARDHSKVFVRDGWSGRTLHTLDAPRADLFLPDGKHVGEGAKKGTFRIWPLDGDPVRTIQLPAASASVLAVTP